MTERRLISFVIPVFNEEDSIDIFLATIRPLLVEEPYVFEFIFVNDGSRDSTLARLLAARAEDSRVKIVDFSRNFGKEQALAAGFKAARGDALIPMDVDLQDSPELITAFLRKWEEGYDMVTGVRTLRTSDTLFKRLSARCFYSIFQALCTHDLIPNAGDFRLLDRKVVDVLNALPERVRFTKGLYAWAGFRQALVPYARMPRAAGNTKWSAWKLWNFALDGITGFSTLPLRMWSYVGIFFAFIGFSYATFLVGRTLLFGSDLPGYPSLMVVLLCLGGIILMSLGIMGEYLGRIYEETKQRPLYIVREYVGFDAAVADCCCPHCGHLLSRAPRDGKAPVK